VPSIFLSSAIMSTSDSLAYLLHYCIRRRGFLNAVGERGQGFGSGDRSGGLICLVKDTSAEIEVKRCR
jgi:hypothetical protein